MPLTNAGAARMLNGGGLISATASLHVSLHSASPTNGNELTGSDMARLEVTDSEVTVSTNILALSGLQDFAEPSTDIGTATHWALYSAASGGDILVSDGIEDVSGSALSIVIVSGTRIRLPLGQGLQVTLPLS